MRKFISILLAAVCLCSCAVAESKITAEGPDVTLNPQTGPFNAISAGSVFVVNYTEGAVTSVSVTVPSSLAKYTKVETSGNELKCYFDNRGTDASINLNGRKVVVNVTAPGVSMFSAAGASTININSSLSASDIELDTSGASSIITRHPLKTKDIDIEASGASHISLADINTGDCEIDASGSAKITVGKVTATDMDITASGASKAEIAGLTSNDCTIGISGTAVTTIPLISTPKIDIECSGASKAKINGHADHTVVKASGSSCCDITNLKIANGKISATGASTIKANSTAGRCKVSTTGTAKVKY